MSFGWTKEDAERHLQDNGIIWDIGQLPQATKRHLDKIASRQRAFWPWYHSGTIEKTCWTPKGGLP